VSEDFRHHPGSLVFLPVPRYRHNEMVLAEACGAVFLSLWIDKGIGLPELLIAAANWAAGSLILTVPYKMALSVRERRLFFRRPPAALKVLI
jgi:molybdopterin-containing oxidoreductase family membrane subunit